MKTEAYVEPTAWDRIAVRLARGSDVVIIGGAEATRDVLAACACRLEDINGVVRVGAPPGGLSLSGLIAQLSGKGNLQDQDDSVLEAGVRRLTEAALPGQRTVMVLDSAAGLHRSAFRFLRQLSLRVPNMLFLIASFPDLPTLLDETGMEGLRQRLGAEAVLPIAAEAGAAEPAVHETALDAWAADELAALPKPAPGTVALRPAPSTPAPVRVPPEWRTVTTAPARSRRPLFWTAAAMGMAASLAVGAWLGVQIAESGQPLASSAGPGADQRAEMLPASSPARPAAPASQRKPMSTPIVAAQVTAPALAAVSPPTVMAAPSPQPAALARAELARTTRPELATPSGPPSLAPAEVAEASLAVASREVIGPEEGGTGEIAPALALPRDAPPARPHVTPRGARATAERAAEERRRVVASHPQRLAAAPAAGLGRFAPVPQMPAAEEERQANREMRPYPGEPDGRESDWSPPVRYRRWMPSQGWRGERSMPPAEGAYIGTYEAGPYGARVFRYEP